MLTQLIYNHALRVRVKADVDSNLKEEPSSSGPSKGSKNFSGKLFNLATSDVANLLEGREFLQIRTSHHVHMCVCAELEVQCSHRFGLPLAYTCSMACSAGGTSFFPGLRCAIVDERA